MTYTIGKWQSHEQGLGAVLVVSDKTLQCSAVSGLTIKTPKISPVPFQISRYIFNTKVNPYVIFSQTKTHNLTVFWKVY